MAGTRIGIGNTESVYVSHFVVDSIDELAFLPTTTKGGAGEFELYKSPVGLGSDCIVGTDDDDPMIYMLFTSGWKKFA